MKMNRIAVILATLTMLCLATLPVQAQTLATTTTLSAAIDASQTTITLASTSGVTAGTSRLYIPKTGEMMMVTAVPVSGTVTVRRGVQTYPIRAATSSTVIVARAEHFTNVNWGGACTRGTAPAHYLPLINWLNGNIFNCRSDSLWYGTNALELTLDSVSDFTGD